MPRRVDAQVYFDIARDDPGSWAILNRIFLPTAGRIFSFDKHEYLQEPFSIQAPLIVVQKGAQLGFSERAVIRAIHDCAYRLSSGLIYYFPTKVDVGDFSKARFGPLIAENPILKDLIQDTDSVNIKKVGRCMLYLRGLRSAVSAKSAPADKLVYDEIDEANPEMVDLSLKRLDHSEFQEVEALSTPTIPDYGINAMFLKTDQRYRQIYCEGCGKYTCLERDFPNCLRRGKDGVVKRICSHCHKELDLGHESNEYVADFPGKQFQGRAAVGYRISQLHSPLVSLEKIMEEYENTKFQADFYNSRLADAYIDAANRLDTAHVLALCGTHGLEFNSQVSTAIGVDIGPEQHHVVVARREAGNTARIVWIGTSDWDGLDSILHRYNGNMVMDGLPEPDKSRVFAGKHMGRAWACFYNKSAAAPYRWDEEKHSVMVYQTSAMDASHAMLQGGKVILPRRMPETVEFADHCHNVARKKVEDEETGQVKHQWIKLGADHYRKAFNFACLAMERTSESKYSGKDYGDLLKKGFWNTYS